MKPIGGVALALVALLIATPTSAAEADLCSGLKAAWTAAKADPGAIRDTKLAGADRCSFSDNDLRCVWSFESPDAARRTYDGFRAVVTTCMAPLGLTPVHKVLHGVETTSLEAAAGGDPNVDVFLPPENTVVVVVIVTAD